MGWDDRWCNKGEKILLKNKNKQSNFKTFSSSFHNHSMASKPRKALTNGNDNIKQGALLPREVTFLCMIHDCIASARTKQLKGIS